MGVIMDNIAVKISKTQKCLNVLHIAWRFPILDIASFFWLHFDAIGADN
jgi:hypothetical protein